MTARDAHVSAVGLKQGNFAVDANGQATYRIPIQLPPGIANFQPSLELVYSHRQPNGLLGVGWDLAGLSVITRMKATYAVDGFNAPIAYDANDRYAIDGQRLINVEGDYGAGNTLYYTELQSWQHIRAGATPEDGFTVVTKSGLTHEYGQTPDSRILATGTQNIRVWALNAMTDRNGNRVEFTYTLSPGGSDDSASGAYYLDSIRYTKHGDVAPSRLVQCTYEVRPDPIVDYVGGYLVRMSYRMQQLTASLDGQVVRSYTMLYHPSTATALSCLETITESGAQSAGEPSLPPTRLGWQDIDAPGFDIGSPSTLDQHLGTPDIHPMDVTGSGRTDLVQVWTDGNNALHATAYLATQEEDGKTLFVRAADTELGAFPATRDILPVDVNGDGRTDLLVAYQNSSDNALRLAVFLSDGTGAFTDGGTFNTGDTWSTNHIQFFAIDANGDGRTDLVEAYAHYDPNQGDRLYFRSYLSTFGDGDGKMFTQGIVSPTDDAATLTAQLAFWPMDVNGDGMIDLVRVWQRGSDAHIIATAYISVSTDLDDVSFATKVDSDLGTFSLQNQVGFLPVDVNGDGVEDMLQIWQEPGDDGTTMHLSTFFCNAAGGFVAGPDSTFTSQTIDDFFPMDVDGSGLTAIVSKWISGDDKLMFTVFRASPSGVYRALPPFDAGVAGTTVATAAFFPSDVNGDGKADLVRAALDGNQQVVVVPYTSSGPYPDLLTSITTPLGGSVTVEYAPLSNSDAYVPENEPVFPAGSGRRYPNPLTPTQYPIQSVLGRATYVVSQYTSSNAPTLNRFSYGSTTQMTYAGAQLNLLGRGWEGFRTVNSLSTQTGKRTVKTYHQDFPYTGNLAQVRIEIDGTYAPDPRVPDDQTAVLMTLTSFSYTSVVSATGATGTRPQVLEVLKTSSQFEQYDYGTFAYALGQTYEYDAYANETLNVYLGYVDPSTGQPVDPAEVVYRYRLFQNDTAADGWALGYLLYAKDSANASDPNITQFLPGDYHLEKRTYCANTYNLESEGKWDDTHNLFLTTTYDYDEYGNRTSETQPGDFVTTYDYDPDYHTFRMTTTTPNDAQGVPLTIATGWDPRFGVEVANRDPNGFITIKGLDAFGRIAVLQGPVPGGGASDPNAVTALVTGSADLRQAFQQAMVVSLEVTDNLDDGQGGLYTQVQTLQSFPVDTTRNFVWKQTYVDGRGRDRETVRQTGQRAGNVVVLTDYNGSDKITSQSLPFFSPTAIVSSAPHSTLTTYDVLDRPLTQHVPAGDDGNQISSTTWTYGSGGTVTQVSAAGSNTPYTQVFTHHYYDGKDKVRQVAVDPDGANFTSQFIYDPVARLINATDPSTATNPQGVSNTITYDSLDRRKTVDNPDQNTTHDPTIKAMTYLYDATTGSLSQQINAAQETTTYSYDALSRLTSTALSDGRTFILTYDDASTNGIGRLSRVVTNCSGGVQSQYDYGYDPYGNTTSITLTIARQQAPFVTGYVFDPQKRLIQETFPDTTVLTRDYACGALVSQALDGARTDYPLEDYTPWQRAGKLVYGQGILPGSGVVTDYTFNPSGQLTNEVVTGSAGQVLNYGYGYDLLNQLLGVTDNNDSSQNQSFTYVNRRLTATTMPGFDAGSYDYDASGNFLTKDSVSYTYQAHFPSTGTQNGQQVYAATPDACGRTKIRTASGTTSSFEYDGLGCLRRVATSDDHTVREMVSDYQGRLLTQTNAQGDTVVFVNPAYMVLQPAGGGMTATVTKYLMDDRGTAASLTNDGSSATILYFRRDYKGSNTHAFGADGTVVTQVAYSGYGQVVTISGTADFRPQYEQREWDNDIGLYYFGARYYDPMTGRFLTPDTLLGSQDFLRADALNRFAFELNNPINCVDPTGHSADWIIGLIIGIVITVAAAALLVATGGSTSPLVAAGLSALWGGFLGAGLNVSIYSATHRDVSGSKFWKGWGAEFGVGFAIGAVTGGFASWYGGVVEGVATRFVSRLAQFGVRFGLYAVAGAPVTGGADAFNQFLSNVIDTQVVGRDVGFGEGVLRAFETGLVFGTIGGFGQALGEVAFLKPRFGAEGLETQPLQLKRIVGDTFIEEKPLIPELYKVTKRVFEGTVKARAVLLITSEASAIGDATLEAKGY